MLARREWGEMKAFRCRNYSVNTYEVIVVNEFHEEMKELVTLKIVDNSEKKIMFETEEEGQFHLTFYPELNCYNQEDHILITAIKEKVLLPPSTLSNYHSMIFYQLFI